MARCLYNSTISMFLGQSSEALLGHFVNNYHGTGLTTTNEAWNSEINIMQETLRPWKDESGQIIFEYDIPRLGKRIDVVLLLIKFIAQRVYNGQLTSDWYPIDRGICIKLSGRNVLLWTHGVVPSIKENRRYYQGGHCIPSPLKITKYYGNGDLETIAKEIIGFTKMNWNSFNLYTKLPATIDTSNTLAQVGNLLRDYNGITYDYRYFI